MPIRAAVPIRAVVTAVSVVLATMCSLTPATAAADASKGPPLTVPQQDLDAALTCSGDPAADGPEPVLFVHGTTSTSHDNWSWNWNRAFEQRHRAYCDVDLPESGTGDIQVSAEYVVAAIRTLHERSGGRRIGIVGHSQGGMIGRWALKFWPDTRAMVGDYVGLSGSNHGSTALSPQCVTIGCAAAYWQQSAGSHFLDALNSGGPETYPGIDYTEIATRYDERVVPYTSAYLPAGPNVTNVAVQDLCPTELVEHLGMAYDNAAWLLGEDALTHPGPARPARVDRGTCGDPLMPGVDPVMFPIHAAAAVVGSERADLEARALHAEPPLAPYAR